MLTALRRPLSELGAGQRVTVELSVDAEQMARFAELSGDHNPLHVDDEFARSKGFEGRLVYGALLVARISELIGMRLPGRDSVWASLHIQFLAPLYVGQQALLEAEVANRSGSTGLLELELSLRRAGRRLAKGRAEVVVVES
jgi:acyl dehydratase